MERRTKAPVMGFMLAALLAGAAVPAAAQEFVIDGVHSSVGFAVRHMVVSTVRGTFTGVTGTIHLDTEHPEQSSVKAEIDAASVDTHNAERDGHLKSADFLDAANHPKITFTSESVSRSGDTWTVRGPLTIRGVTRPVEIRFRLNGPVKDPWGNVRIGIEAEPVELDRKAFGLAWNRTLDSGGVVVGDTVTVTLSLEAVQKKPQSAAAAE